MKKISIILLLCFLGFCFAANDQKVTVTGFATEKKPTKEAYEDALQNALRNAVEKNLGTWIKSQSSSVNFSDANSLNQAKYDILSKANDFIVNYKVLKRGLSSKGLYEITIEAVVSTDRLSGELRKYVGELKSKMDNPSIAFVLTSWEKKGVFTTVTSNASLSSKNSYSGNAEASTYANDEASVDASVRSQSSRAGNSSRNSSVSANGRYSGSASGSYSGAVDGSAHVDGDENSVSYRGKHHQRANADYSAQASADYNENRSGGYDSNDRMNASYSAQGRSTRQSDRASKVSGSSEVNAQASLSVTTGKIDENLYAKFADMSIIDGFQQEFKEKGFDLKAADRAREIAVAPSALQTGININDRSAVRDLAEKEGANFVARGEVMLLGQSRSAATGQIEVTGKIGTEIIDVNSGDVVASYSNTVTVSNSNVDKAKAQLIKKASVVAARTLASQTLQTWQERAEKGRQYTVEIRNMTKARSQKLPFEKALKSIASISSQTSPSKGVQTYTLLYKGNKSDLGEAIIGAIGDAKGFSEEEFDGPNDENGKIVFSFTK